MFRFLMVCAAAFGLWLCMLMPSFAAENDPAATSASPRPAYVFALSWQPGFCERRPTRAECRDQTVERPDASRFSLHGLWPAKRRYCGVSNAVKALDRDGKWLDLPAVPLSPETAARLAVAMPGVRSGLDRHQWQSSGTCHGGTAEAYFRLQLDLLDLVNASPVQALFARSIGKEIRQEAVQAAFDAAFGAGAGERVRMRCDKVGDRLVITGLTLGLAGEPQSAEGLGALVQAANTTDFRCRAGLVDRAGAG